MKKLLALMMALAMVLALAACGSTGTGSAKSAADGSGSAGNADGKTYKVGIVNWVDHASLNQIIENLEAELDRQGEALGVTFDYQDYYDNAQADQSVLSQIGANMIAGRAEVHGSFRFLTVADSEKILKKLQEITTYSYVPKTKTVIVNDVQQCFMPMEKTEGNVALYEIVKAQADKLRIPAEGIFKNAGADSCWTTMMGAPTICAMGGRGELNHTDKEYLRLDSLRERAKLLALSIEAIH